MELKLKHIAGYLPYGVKVEIERLCYPKWKQIYTLSVKELYEYKSESYKMKLILSPLSNLTKEIEVNGEKFVPLEKLNEDSRTKHYIDKWGEEDVLLVDYEKGYNVTYNMTAKDLLYKWHFDVHGLIEKGLAISIHDAEQDLP